MLQYIELQVREGKNLNKDIIIKRWRVGYTVKQITKQYINANQKKHEKEKKMTFKQAQAYVEQIIFDYQTGLLRGDC